MISHYSHPYRSVYGTQRVGAFVKYLSRLGWDVSLVTTRPGNPSEEEPGGGQAILSEVEVIRLPQRMPRMLGGGGFLVPDDFIHWVLPAVSAAREAARKRPTSVLYATAPPYSNLIAGAIVSALLRLPLVSDFRDPWSRIDVSAWTIDGPLLGLLNRALEVAVLRASDAVVMADELDYANEFFARYDEAIRGKVVSISNGYDEEVFAASLDGRVTEKPDKFMISYVGMIYGDETFENLTRPLRIWQEHHPRDLESVLFEYAGPSSHSFDRLGFRPTFLRDHGYLSHEEAIRLRAKSQVQLFAQPRSFKPHVLSGKVFEMIRVGVPILAVTNLTGSAARLVQRTGTGFVVDPGDPEAAAEILHTLFVRWRRGEQLTTVNWPVVAEYSRERSASRLAEVLERVARAPAPIAARAKPGRRMEARHDGGSRDAGA